MMWFVVHFFNDESVEAVPDTWLKINQCAWPNDKKNVKKYIEKRIIPNQLKFKWLPARKLGNAFSSLDSARAKSKVVQYVSDLSTNEDIQIVKNEETLLSKKKNYQYKRIASPPTLKMSDLNKKFKILGSSNEESEIEEDYYDSDKDPEYISTHHHVKDKSDTKQSDQFEILHAVNDNENLHYIIQSPIGKIMVENIDNDNGKKNYLTSKAERHTNNENKSNAGYNTSAAVSYIPSPTIEKTMVKHVNSTSEPQFNSYAKRSLHFEHRPSNEYIQSIPSIHSSVTELNTNKKPLMSNAEFQAFVISSLTKLEFEINNMSSIIQATHVSSEAFYKNVERSTSLNFSNNLQISMDISEIFPLSTDDQLKKFDEQLKSNNDFKLNVLAKLSLFVGIKSVGDSVRRLMSRMFSDELLQNYSLLGFKKKNRFSDFLVYRLILDAIRVQPKFSGALDKEIHVSISTWLSRAKFRLKDKKNAV